MREDKIEPWHKQNRAELQLGFSIFIALMPLLFFLYVSEDLQWENVFRGLLLVYGFALIAQVSFSIKVYKKARFLLGSSDGYSFMLLMVNGLICSLIAIAFL